MNRILLASILAALFSSYETFAAAASYDPKTLQNIKHTLAQQESATAPIHKTLLQPQTPARLPVRTKTTLTHHQRAALIEKLKQQEEDLAKAIPDKNKKYDFDIIADRIAMMSIAFKENQRLETLAQLDSIEFISEDEVMFNGTFKTIEHPFFWCKKCNVLRWGDCFYHPINILIDFMNPDLKACRLRHIKNRQVHGKYQ